MSRRKQLKPRSLKRDAVDGDDLVAMVTDDAKDNQSESNFSNDNNNEISSAVASISGGGCIGGCDEGDDDDDEDDDEGAEMGSDHSHSPRRNNPSMSMNAEENGEVKNGEAEEEDDDEEEEEEEEEGEATAAAAAAVASEIGGSSICDPTAAKKRKKKQKQKKRMKMMMRQQQQTSSSSANRETVSVEEEEEYRCDVCHAIFASWHRFIDHRNYDCTSGSRVTWMNQESQSRLSFSPSSDREVSPMTPSSAEISPDPLPYAIGPDENHPFACKSCEKSYSKQSYLKKHEQLTHNDQLHYGCKYCDRQFRHKRSRDRHVKLHTGDRHYRCRQCQAMFARSDHLKVHLKTHENLRSFGCPECNLNFTNISALTAHMLTHVDTEEGQKDETSAICYNCPLCSMTLSSAKQLEKHVECHSSAISYSKTKLEDDEDKDVDVDGSANIKCEKSSNDCECDDHSTAAEEKMCLDQPRRLPARRMFTRGESPWSNKDSDKSMWKKSHESGVPADGGGSGLDCPYCSQRDFNTVTLSIHISTLHSNISGNFFSCPICFIVFSSALKLEQHVICAHQRNFPERIRNSLQCEFCLMEFLDSASHRLHMDSIHPEKNSDSSKGGTVATIYCSQCTMGFPHIYALADHMHQSHGYNKFANSNGSNIPYPSLSPFHLHSTSPEQLVAHSYRDLQKLMVDTIVGGSLQDGFRCHQCDLNLADYHSFQLHIDSHQAANRISNETSSLHQCTDCEMSFPLEEQLESHMFSHFLSLTTEYGCTSCLKLFSKPDELQKHLMDIHAHHLYRCSLCKHVFDSKVNIQVHFAVKHSNECKVYKCTRCASVFRSEMECQLHVKVHHLGVSKPYRCFFCKDSFAVESDLQTHVATHKKQFVCPICHEAFLVEYLLDKHLETKHSSPDVSLGNGSSRQDISAVASLLAPPHSLSHDGILLGLPTSSPSSIASEKKTSASPSVFVSGISSPSSKKGDLIYKCEVCDVKFSDEGTLQKHHTHDHCLSAEMQQLMKSRSASQQSANLEKSSSLSGTSGQTSGDKFSQLCMYCKQMFKTKGELEKHMKTHVLPSNQKCNICDEVFPSAMILAEHKLTHCKVVKGNVCIVCKISMKNEDEFFSHSQQHSFQGANLQCVICRQTLASMLELQLHGRHHFQTTPVEVYSCCICLKSFDSKENLISRLGASSGTELGGNGSSSYYICKPCYHHEGAALAELKCSTCEMKFDSHVLLAVHSLEHRRTYQCIKCQESFGTEYEIQLHVATHVLHEGNVHECKICASVFDSPAKLQLHLIEHSFQGKLEMNCYICDRSFAQASAIQVHMLDHGMANRKYVCSICPQRFFFSAELQNHRLTLNHNSSPTSKSNGTELPCPDCSKVFTNYANLSAHRRSHEKQPAAMLECTVCPVQCSNMRALQEHLLASHSELGSNKVPLQCPECNRQFPSLSSLQGHMRVHNSGTKYSCTECGKAFSLPQNLAIHINSHRDDIRPYECSACHKKFAKKENMKSHMRSHCSSKDQYNDQSASSGDHAADAVKMSGKMNSAQSADGVGSGVKLNRSHGDTSSKPEEHLCPICGGRFQQMADLALHVNKIHHIKAEVVEAEIVQTNDAPHLLSRSTKQSLPSNESILCSNGITAELEPRVIPILATK